MVGIEEDILQIIRAIPNNTYMVHCKDAVDKIIALTKKYTYDKTRFFQVLDQMNLEDTNNKTNHVVICPDVTNIQTGKISTKVTFGAPNNAITATEMLGDNDKKIAIMIVIDKDRFEEMTQ